MNILHSMIRFRPFSSLQIKGVVNKREFELIGKASRFEKNKIKLLLPGRKIFPLTQETKTKAFMDNRCDNSEQCTFPEYVFFSFFCQVKGNSLSEFYHKRIKKKIIVNKEPRSHNVFFSLFLGMLLHLELDIPRPSRTSCG